MEKERVILPVTNENGYYEIRLESIGGLGANLCGKMLGELGLFYLGLNSASFSSYGSEKTGTPVKGFIRFSAPDVEIRLHSPIETPHLLAVFHDALLEDATALNGCKKETAIVINMADVGHMKRTLQKGSTECRKSLARCRKVYGIDAGGIAMETHSRINVVMLGAMARIMGFVELSDLEEICKKALGRKYPAALAGNLSGIRKGFEAVTEVAITDIMEDVVQIENAVQMEDAVQMKDNAQMEADAQRQSGIGLENDIEIKRDIPGWGYDTAPIGGVNPHYGNSVVNDLLPSRQGYFPIFIPERCINCGLCDTTCPDMVFQFEKGEYKGREMMVNRGLDYYHCKGCLRCVEVCPVAALVSGREAEHPDKQYFRSNQELLRNPLYYEKAGPDGYITSESFLTEKRMEKGEV